MRVLLAAALLLAPRAAGVAVDRCETTGPSSQLVLRTRPQNVSASGGRRGPVSLSFTVPAYNGPPAPTPAPTATTTTVTTRPHYYEDDRAEI